MDIKILKAYIESTDQPTLNGLVEYNNKIKGRC